MGDGNLSTKWRFLFHTPKRCAAVASKAATRCTAIRTAPACRGDGAQSRQGPGAAAHRWRGGRRLHGRRSPALRGYHNPTTPMERRTTRSHAVDRASGPTGSTASCWPRRQGPGACAWGLPPRSAPRLPALSSDAFLAVRNPIVSQAQPPGEREPQNTSGVSLAEGMEARGGRCTSKIARVTRCPAEVPAWRAGPFGERVIPEAPRVRLAARQL